MIYSHIINSENEPQKFAQNQIAIRGGHGNPPKYACLEIPMDKGAWGISSEDDTKFSELPEVRESALSSLLFNTIFPEDFPRILKTHQTLSWL